MFSCNIKSKSNSIAGRYEHRIINFPTAYLYEKQFKHKFIVIKFNLNLESDSTFTYKYCNTVGFFSGKWRNTLDSIVLYDVKLPDGGESKMKIKMVSIPKFDKFILWPICQDSLCSKFSYVMLEKVK